MVANISDYGHVCIYTRQVKRRGRRHKVAPSYDVEVTSVAGTATLPVINRPSGISSDAADSRQRINSDRSELQDPGLTLPYVPTTIEHWQSGHGSEGFHENSGTPSYIPTLDTQFQASERIIPSGVFPRPPRTRNSSIAAVHQQNPLEQPSPYPSIGSNPDWSPHTHHDFSSNTNARSPTSINREKNCAICSIEASEISVAAGRNTNSTGSTSATRCYRVLQPILPILDGIIPNSVACELLHLYFGQPGSSLFNFTPPYVLTQILHRRALLHRSPPRATSSALLLAMLHAAAHTADVISFHVPGSRAVVCDKLYAAVVTQLNDPDDWHRLQGGGWVKLGGFDECSSNGIGVTRRTGNSENSKLDASIDDLLAMVLLTVVVSGGTFKADCLRWWNKALRLARAMNLVQLDSQDSLRERDGSFSETEAIEEKRRMFWLVFCLDRHLALSYNAPLAILDADISVYLPLPEPLWENLDLQPLPASYRRTYGPRTTITGTGFFEFFLPLMTILGDIVLLHHRRLHPRLGGPSDAADTAIVENLLKECERSLQELKDETKEDQVLVVDATASTPATSQSSRRSGERMVSSARAPLVAAYSSHILHVLAVLLYGKWDPLTMLTASPRSSDQSTSTTEDSDNWMTPERFMKCASHAVFASQEVATIISLDPELVFMPYLFGIYLLHGSFVLLLFADRMPQLGGPNPEVEQACETIIRAHEICVVTLTTEFQRNFRKLLRSTLYSVRSPEPNNLEGSRVRRTALQMYRWNRGGRGLAL